MSTNSDDNTERLSLKLDKIEDKIDHVVSRVCSIDVTLAVQAESLKEHIARTALLEKAVVPLVKKDNQFHGALKLIGLLGILAAIGEGIVAVLGYFKR